MKFQVTKFKILILLSGLVLLLLGLLLDVNRGYYYTGCTWIFFVIGIVYSCKKLNERFALFAFDIGFFVFLMSGYSFRMIKTGGFSYFSNSYFTSTDEANIHTCFALFLCIYVINCSYIIIKRDIKNEWSFSEMRNPKYIQTILFMIILVSFVAKLVEEFEQVALVNLVTYYESGQYLSSLPSFVTHISSMFYISCFLYLATFPNKRKTLFCIGLIGIIALTIMSYGERGEPISLFFVIILYIAIRNRIGINDIKIKKRYIFIVVVLLPIVIFGLQKISYNRNKSSYNVSIDQGIQDFFESQGGSVKIIANSYDLHEKIENMAGHSFVLGEIRFYLSNNIVARMISGKSKTLRTVDDAYSGDNFLRTYGYAYSPVTYSRFVGSGSTYIAEVYHDGGYIFLCLISICYAFLLCKIDSINVKNFIAIGIYLNIFRYIPLIPRGMALDWFVNTFAVQNLLLYFVILLMSQRGIKKNGVD